MGNPVAFLSHKGIKTLHFAKLFSERTGKSVSSFQKKIHKEDYMRFTEEEIKIITELKEEFIKQLQDGE